MLGLPAWAKSCARRAHAATPQQTILPTLPSGSLHRIGLLQLREIALPLELVDDAEIEIVVDVAAADVGADRLELRQHVLGARARWRGVARHQALEIRIGGRDHLGGAGL